MQTKLESRNKNDCRSASCFFQNMVDSDGSDVEMEVKVVNRVHPKKRKSDRFEESEDTVAVTPPQKKRRKKTKNVDDPEVFNPNMLDHSESSGEEKKRVASSSDEKGGEEDEAFQIEPLEADDNQDEEDEVYVQASKNEVGVLDACSVNEAFRAIAGDTEDMEDFESRFATYGKDEWKLMAESLFKTNIDANCSNRDLLVLFRLFYQLFCFPYKDDYAVIDRVKAIYPHVANMRDQFKKIQRLFGTVHFELLKRNLVDDQTRIGREIQRMLTFISFGMKMSFEQLVTNRLLQKGTDKSMRSMLEEMSPLTFFQEIDTTKLKKHQQLIHFYYREAFKHNYRKDGDCIYRPRYNKYDEFVFAYEYVFDVPEFVYSSIYPLEQNHYWFECLTERNNNAKMCIDILTNVKSEWLQKLERNHNIHSFQNGLFVLSLNTFFYYKKLPGKHWVGDLTGNIIAIKYHDIEFDEEGMNEDMDRFRVRSYMSIQMEDVKNVFTTQGFTVEEIRWIYALLGRMLHPLGSMDTWQVFPYFLGLAGTGKSTSLRLLASLLEPRDVGYLNNTLQKTFALEGIFDKLIYLALDIDEYFQLDQATFNSMVAGEEVSVLRKYKRPMTVLWNIHGGFAGNKLPPWSDNGGSLSRRLIVIEFLTPISRCDPNLYEKCLNQKDRFLKVITSAYHDLSRKYKNRSIKEVIPEKFKQAEAKALLELNVLMSFIKDCADLDPNNNKGDERPQTYIQSFKDFGKAFKNYCKRMSCKHKPLNYNFYSSVFAKHGLKLVKPEKASTDPFGQDSQYVLGLKLKDVALEDSSE